MDANGVAFPIHGDAAWSLLVQLDLDETDDYLEARQRQGFNTLIVNLIEHQFADDPPRNVDGQSPFASNEPFAKPNPAYFDHAVTALEHARDRGFLVLLAPAYLGYDGGDEGWYQDMAAAGEDRLVEYGRYVGQRFAHLDNVIWLHGGDFTPPPEGLVLVEAVRRGILQGGATQLETAHWGPESSAADVPVAWLDLNTTYTYGPVHVASTRDEERGLGIPHFLVESAYENDIKQTTPQSIRAQAYDALLTGAAGQVYGHGDIWQFRPQWRDALDSPGARDMTRVRALLEQLPWPDLVPDLDHSLLAEGGGTFGTADHAPAAATPDRSTVVVYVPSPRVVVLDLGVTGAEMVASWYDPTTGSTRPAATTVTAGGRLRVEPADENATGDPDWVLVLTASDDLG